MTWPLVNRSMTGQNVWLVKLSQMYQNDYFFVQSIILRCQEKYVIYKSTTYFELWMRKCLVKSNFAPPPPSTGEFLAIFAQNSLTGQVCHSSTKNQRGLRKYPVESDNVEFLVNMLTIIWQIFWNCIFISARDMATLMCKFWEPWK